METEKEELLRLIHGRELWERDIKLYPNGILSRRRPSRVVSSAKPSKRGEIKGFSRHSLLRLRQLLLTQIPDNPFFTSLGVTLTLPWRVSVDSDEVSRRVHDDYKKAFHRFSVSFQRRFSGSVAVVRHELQRRGVPHCHIVLYLSDFDFNYVARGRSATAAEFRAIVFSLWLRSLKGFEYDLKLSAFARRGIKVESLNSNLAIFRYLCDHSSKMKRSQLGYRGKQWCVLNRALLIPAAASFVSFDDLRSKQVFFRHVGRVTRFFIPSKCVFGRKLSRPFGMRSVIFVDRSTSDRILSALRSGFIS